MGLRINTNVQSLRAQLELGKSREKFELAQNKLASGTKITRAQDDPAGLAISENLRSVLRATGQNISNAQNGLLMLETAEGALNEITEIVIRMRELATQAASDTNGDKERSYLNQEFQSIKSELERISQSTTFNGRPLINGEGGNTVIQVGVNNVEDVDRIEVATDFEVTVDSLNLDSSNISYVEDARSSIEDVSGALDQLSNVRGQIGAAESRLSSAINNLLEYKINASGAFSRIKDADLAHETAERTKYQILSQAGIAVLAQANNAPQLALKLLG